jgi:single-strand DNA-binding protein
MDKKRSIVEIKAKRIQFLNKLSKSSQNGQKNNEESSVVEDDTNIEETSFNKFLTDEEANLINNND